jgi:hypothetical protein
VSTVKAKQTDTMMIYRPIRILCRGVPHRSVTPSVTAKTRFSSNVFSCMAIEDALYYFSFACIKLRLIMGRIHFLYYIVDSEILKNTQLLFPVK